ncbi:MULTISPECIES: hypothetical protein [Marinomonas]|uniref:Uncharacterized protein n=1 Tax=Marinomonas rhodophyticola TaxID=2992803 RepID=A0ABT3KEH9_9GAMM|nr:hypothetical protein [Marinomonas sp. KJ51-3]MCW4628913.1 hypothetical protein [Marinomonas sp. KJ51-3]
MSLLAYLKSSAFFSFEITRSIVLLFILLQMAVWYPLLSNLHDDVSHHTRLNNQAENEWRQWQKQANYLRQIHFPDTSWVQQRVVATEIDRPTQWLIEGTASLIAWQSVLEQVETQLPLVLHTVSWQRTQLGNWQGRLRFGLGVPKQNREYHNWLPTQLRTRRFNKDDWRLVSTMRVGAAASAMLNYKNHRYWITRGSWLPEAGMTVNAVSFDQITLVARDGSIQRLQVREERDQYE